MNRSETIEIEVAGRVYQASGSLRLGLGKHQRQGVSGGGYKEMPIAQFVEGRVVFREPVRGDMLRAIADATVTYNQASGRRSTLRNAWVDHAEDGQHSNEYDIKIIGEIEG